jgi:hypothetical protein
MAVLRESDAGRRFIDMLRSNEFTRRLRFLEYYPDAPSIIENFKVSQDRLPKPNGPSLAVINFLGMIIIYLLHTTPIVHKTLSFFSSVYRDRYPKRGSSLSKILLRPFVSTTTSKRLSRPRDPRI